MRQIHIIHGPNLHRLGSRDAATYGALDLPSLNSELSTYAGKLGYNLIISQHNDEGGIINSLYAAEQEACGIVLNPAGFSHSSVAIRDAMDAVQLPIIEVHLSNLYAREDYRQTCITASAATQIICGGHLNSYLLGIHAIHLLVNA